MTAINHARRLAPIRGGLSESTVNRKIEEISAILREMQQQIAEGRGVSGPDAVSLGRHLDVQGHRLQNVGPTRAETDVPNVRELRQQGLYARDGIHETDKLIVARGGIRTVTPAIAPNDLITLGQARTLVGGVGSSQNNVSDGSDPPAAAPTGAWAYSQVAVTLGNGLTSDWALPAAVYLRITGPTAAFALGGFRSVANGRYLILHNATAQDMTLVNEDPLTPATHRIQTGTGADLVMSGVGVTTFLYSLADARWIVV